MGSPTGAPSGASSHGRSQPGGQWVDDDEQVIWELLDLGQVGAAGRARPRARVMSSRVSEWTGKNFPKIDSSSSGEGSARSTHQTSSGKTEAAVAGNASDRALAAGFGGTVPVEDRDHASGPVCPSNYAVRPVASTHLRRVECRQSGNPPSEYGVYPASCLPSRFYRLRSRFPRPTRPCSSSSQRGIGPRWTICSGATGAWHTGWRTDCWGARRMRSTPFRTDSSRRSRTWSGSAGTVRSRRGSCGS